MFLDRDVYQLSKLIAPFSTISLIKTTITLPISTHQTIFFNPNHIINDLILPYLLSVSPLRHHILLSFRLTVTPISLQPINLISQNYSSLLHQKRFDSIHSPSFHPFPFISVHHNMLLVIKLHTKSF